MLLERGGLSHLSHVNQQYGATIGLLYAASAKDIWDIAQKLYSKC